MKTLIVKIPDDYKYNMIIEGNIIDMPSLIYYMRDIIKKGIEIPENTGKIIDADALLRELEEAYHKKLPEPLAKLFVDITAYIDDAPDLNESPEAKNDDR